jgi:hypothetical protein
MSEQIQIRVEPSHDGTLTRLRLSGETLIGTPPDFGDLVDCLATWSGVPVELVLPADCLDGRWFDEWTALVEWLPVDLLQIRFDVTIGKCDSAGDSTGSLGA